MFAKAFFFFHKLPYSRIFVCLFFCLVFFVSRRLNRKKKKKMTRMLENPNYLLNIFDSFSLKILKEYRAQWGSEYSHQ